MEISADIAAMSVEMSMQKTAQAAQVSILKKSMEAQEAAAAALIEQMAPSTPAPSFGHLFYAGRRYFLSVQG